MGLGNKPGMETFGFLPRQRKGENGFPFKLERPATRLPGAGRVGPDNETKS